SPTSSTATRRSRGSSRPPRPRRPERRCSRRAPNPRSALASSFFRTAVTASGLPPKTVLVVDDEKNIRRTLQLVLEGEGYRFLAAENAGQALSILASPEAPVDLAIFDVKLPDMSGLDALERIKKDDATKDLPIIVISGHATVADAVNAIKLGASDFFEKPLA